MQSDKTHTSPQIEHTEYIMSSSIRTSDETKRKLELVKRDDETFDELLARLATTEKDIRERGGFADDGVVEDMARARDELNRSWPIGQKSKYDLLRQRSFQSLPVGAIASRRRWVPC